MVSPNHAGVAADAGVAAHAVRPLAGARSDEPVEIEVIGHPTGGVAVDGQSVATLAEGDVVTCCPADEHGQLRALRRRHFHQILKTKFGLSDR